MFGGISRLCGLVPLIQQYSVCVKNLLFPTGLSNLRTPVVNVSFFNQQSALGVASAAANSLTLFSLFRFNAGIGTMGCICAQFAYFWEIVITVHRSHIGMISLFLSAGGCILALLAYLIPNWRHLMLAVSLPGFLPLLAWW